jgi:hypothetical protein
VEGTRWEASASQKSIKPKDGPPARRNAERLLMEHRNLLIVDTESTTADGYGERATAIEMLARLPKTARHRTVAGDKSCDTRGFVARCATSGSPPTSLRAPAGDAPPSTDAPHDTTAIR